MKSWVKDEKLWTDPDVPRDRMQRVPGSPKQEQLGPGSGSLFWTRKLLERPSYWEKLQKEKGRGS